MTKQKPNDKRSNNSSGDSSSGDSNSGDSNSGDSSSGDSSDSEEENITMVVDTPDNNNDDKTKEEKEKKRKEGEKKKKRKQRFEDEERKNKNRRKIDPKNPPIIISFFDLINGSRNLEKEGWNSVNSSEQECSCPPSPPPKEKKEIVDDILQEPLNSEYLDLHLETIDDLIKVGKDYSDGVYSPLVRYNINVYKLSKLIGPLEKLKNMIGMENIKRDIFELLLYQLQDFDNSKDMLHTIIEGEPGVGKTDLAKIIANIYQEMGYCTNELVKFVKRSDLIGGYLGQTAIKTQKVLDECKGGVLVIDEAYSLGSPEGRDSYSKECIDTLTRFLSESPETIVFIMGYKEDLEKSLFAHNKGLERRFSYRFTVNKYSADQLRLILFKIIRENLWDLEIEEDIPLEFFEKNLDYFLFNGGDMLNLFTKCKFTHSIRFYNKNKRSTAENNFDHLKKKINFEDIKNGFKLLQKDEKFKDRKSKDEVKNVGMYT